MKKKLSAEQRKMTVSTTLTSAQIDAVDALVDKGLAKDRSNMISKMVDGQLKSLNESTDEVINISQEDVD